MTDRTNYLTVTLNKGYRDDDIQELINAIKQFRQVIDVSLNVAQPMEYSARMQAKRELQEKIWEALAP